MGYPFGYWYGGSFKAQLSSKSRCLEACFHLKDILNVHLNLKENCKLIYAFSFKMHLF